MHTDIVAVIKLYLSSYQWFNAYIYILTSCLVWISKHFYFILKVKFVSMTEAESHCNNYKKGPWVLHLARLCISKSIMNMSLSPPSTLFVLWSYFCFPHSLHAKFVKYKFIIINNTKTFIYREKHFFYLNIIWQWCMLMYK